MGATEGGGDKEMSRYVGEETRKWGRHMPEEICV